MTNPQRQDGSPIEDNHHHVSTSLNYYPVDAGPPIPVIIGEKSVNNQRPSVSIDVVIQDVTGYEDEYKLDKNGFQFVNHTSQEKDFDDEGKITGVYYPEVESLLKEVTGASRVVVFNHRGRRGPSDWDKAGLDNRLNAGPLFKVHIDQSYDGAELQLRNILPDEADELVKRRYQIINVWRPIETVLRDPLAIADASTVSDTDLLPASVVKPDSRSETWAVKPNPAHRWFFKHNHAPDEVVLIKCFDSDEFVARRSPHSAFKIQEQDDGPSRKSIEVRALVFYS
ncbi:hypothetical protein N8I77_002844 [Diaporthe amygdali]|uniref:Uncharacterized protein n=1 Tax=Phomopsis amygdali TaxID=1214568 RepID=A0AAD9SU47_PHOAM|nr:hypothetical protein N8I77_002844 [Diaporthe amygdali]